MDEENNCLTSSGNIQVTPQPNLVVTSVVAGLPKTVEAGDDLAITVVVKNAGLAQARASTMKFVIINTVSGAEKNLNGTATIPIINAGQSATVQKTVKVYSDTASATYNVQACADSTKGIIETFESDNCGLGDGALTVQGIVVGHADLVVTAVPDPPSSVLPSAAFTLAPTVANQGTDPASASTTSFFLVNTSTGAKKNLKGGQAVRRWTRAQARARSPRSRCSRIRCPARTSCRRAPTARRACRKTSRRTTVSTPREP